MIQSRRRRRHASSAFGAPRRTLSSQWMGVVLIILGVALVLWYALRAIVPPVAGQRMATMLGTGGRGEVSVVLSGEEGSQRAESGLRLYEGDRIGTSGGSYAELFFFDDTVVILDEQSSARMGEVLRGEESSFIGLTLERGRLWVETGSGQKVQRIVSTDLASHMLPPLTSTILSSAENDVLSEENVYVFESTGQGLTSTLKNSGRPPIRLIVGEGQQIRVTPAAATQIQKMRIDPYSLRDVLDPAALNLPLYTYASQPEPVPAPEAPGQIPSEDPVEDLEQLLVTAPADESVLPGSTVSVTGTVGARITTVTVSGYAAELTDGTFQKEIALPEEENFTIEIRAEDKDGLLVSSRTLSLSRDIKPPEPPVITEVAGQNVDSSAEDQEPVAVQDDRFEIVGTVSPDSTGVVVNGYRLQKYTPGKPWRYLVDPSIDNVRVGENQYEVVAVDRAGNTSPSAVITVVWKAQPVTPPPVTDDTTPPEERTDVLLPGSIRITAPTDGDPFPTNKDAIAIEGQTAPETASISVNGFQLTLYNPGSTTWRYVASDEYRNYKLGRNLYTIVARNSSGEILDVVRYIIERAE